VHRRIGLTMATCALALGAVTLAQAAPKLSLLDRPVERFQRSITTHTLEQRYLALLGPARRLDVAPERSLLRQADLSPDQLRDGIEELDRRVDRARRAAAKPDYVPVSGVSQATLDAIGACESGGDPTAVDSSGTYYGKYQFDLGTWASVGGNGNPAQAPEAEQDYRASLLYSRAGSSPWPACGQ
jgi:soluble lytic murein transglycosylase-like protein